MGRGHPGQEVNISLANRQFRKKRNERVEDSGYTFTLPLSFFWGRKNVVHRVKIAGGLVSFPVSVSFSTLT